jgi:hypothetical protein
MSGLRANTSTTKYSIDPETRVRLGSRIAASKHAEVRHRERAPHGARSVHHALRNAVVDSHIVNHEFWAREQGEFEREPPDALAVYRGRTEGGEVYSMVYPVDHGPDGPPKAVTSARARGIPRKCEEWGIKNEVATALRSYVITLGQQGGIIDE